MTDDGQGIQGARRDISFLESMLDEKIFPGGELSGFTECYWSNPVVAKAELEQAGFTVLTYAGVEGFASGMGSGAHGPSGFDFGSRGGFGSSGRVSARGG